MQQRAKIAVAIIIAVIVVAGGGVAIYEHYKGNTTPQGNTLIIASSALPASLDPAVAYSTAATLFTDNFYNTLVGYGTQTINGTTVGSLNPVPELATNWTVNPNGSVYFNLRQGVTFQNGDPFNASDVQYSLDRVITMHQGPSFHVRQYLNKSGIHVLGTHAILLVPSQPYPWFLNLFQLWVTGIVDPNWVKANGGVVANSVNNYTANHEMGTGPYELTSYTQSEIILTANPNYWAGKANISKIIYDVVPNSGTQITSLEKGNINMALNVPFDQVANLTKNNNNIKVQNSPTSSEWYIGLDENMTPFNNLSVRKAVLYAINASEINKYASFNYGIVLQSVIAPSIEGYSPTFKQYMQNITEAKYYLNQAKTFLSNNDSKNFSSSNGGFKTAFYYVSNNPIATQVATLAQSQLAAINISVTLDPTTSNVFQTEIGHGHYPMFFEGWVNLLATPDDGLFALFNGANAGLGGNYNFFNNTTVNKDLKNASEQYNKATRDSLYLQIQQILAAQAVEVPLFNQENPIPVTKNVHGPVAYPTYDFFFFNDTMT